MPETDFSALTLGNGGFAMLAIDQRESMRTMFTETQNELVTDDQLTQFKLDALSVLTPYASACLMDRQFTWDAAVAQEVVAPTCGMIAAADHFIPDANEIVADVEIDPLVIPEKVKSDGGVALKLLVTWRPDQPAERRVAMVERFVANCREAGLISIIEPVSRKARDGRETNLAEGILLAAEELGDLGADVYKAEVPLFGRGGEVEVRRKCAELNKRVSSPWVVLSSGVDPDHFPTAVEWACREGARGFLAGRGVWKNCISAPDRKAALEDEAVRRIRRLREVVEEHVRD